MKKLWAIAVMALMIVPAVWAQGTTVSVSVQNDRNGTIQNAFTEALFAAGFTVVSNNADCLLDVQLNVTPVTLSNSSNASVRIDLTANLLDKNGTVLLPYSFWLRESHLNQSMAEDRTFRYTISKINAEYRSLLNDIIAAKPVQPAKQGNTVGLKINADREGIIQNAFTAIFSAAGLRNVSNNADYLLNIHITITPVAVPNNPNTFVRLDLAANFLDNNGNVLLPYTISYREGYHNQAGAEERAFRNAAAKITAEYQNLLNTIISR